MTPRCAWLSHLITHYICVFYFKILIVNEQIFKNNIYHLISNKLDYSSSSKRSSSSSSIWLLLPLRRYYKKNRELKNINTKLAKKDMIANKGKLSEILLTKLDMLVMLHILSLLIPIASKEQTSPDLNFWLPKVVY